MTARFVSTPNSTKIAGQRSRTSITSRARRRRASHQAEKIEKKVGDETTTTSAGPTRRPPSRGPETMKLRWPSVLRTMPSLGVA